MKAELVPANGDAPIPITKDVTVVGRREFCDVEIQHPSLSKRHAVIVRTDGLLMVRDLVSTNGTKVNGQRVMWAALMPNDRLTLGRYKFKVYLGPDHAPSPSEAHQQRMGGAVAAPVKVHAGQSPTFAPPTPLSVTIPSTDLPSSPDPDDDEEIMNLDAFVIDDDDEERIIDLD